jgi:hypothetical protein
MSSKSDTESKPVSAEASSKKSKKKVVKTEEEKKAEEEKREAKKDETVKLNKNILSKLKSAKYLGVNCTYSRNILINADEIVGKYVTSVLYEELNKKQTVEKYKPYPDNDFDQNSKSRKTAKAKTSKKIYIEDEDGVVEASTSTTKPTESKESKEDKKATKKTKAVFTLNVTGKKMLTLVLARFIEEIYSLPEEQLGECTTAEALIEILEKAYAQKKEEFYMSRTIIYTINAMQKLKVASGKYDKNIEEIAGSKPKLFKVVYSSACDIVCKYFNVIAHCLARVVWNQVTTINSSAVLNVMTLLNMQTNMYFADECKNEGDLHTFDGGVLQMCHDYHRFVDEVTPKKPKTSNKAKKDSKDGDKEDSEEKEEKKSKAKKPKAGVKSVARKSGKVKKEEEAESADDDSDEESDSSQ